MYGSDAGAGTGSADTGAGAPLPWNDPEYVRFVSALESSSNLASTNGMTAPREAAPAPSEVYQNLINRETRALDTVDRVVNDARKTALASTQLVDLPMRDLAFRAMSTGRSIMDDLVDANSPTDVRDALISGDRKVFLGAALIFVAIAAALVTSFSPTRVS